VNLGIEGMMLCGCVAGIIGAAVGGWPLGLACGALTGALLGALLAAIVLLGGANLIVAGIGIGLLATGLSDYAFELWQRNTVIAAFPFAPVIVLPGAAHESPLLAALLEQSVMTWVALLLATTLAGLLNFGRMGPVLQAVGSDPEVARLRGVAVTGWQAAALLVGGTLAGLAGAIMTVAYVGSFTSGMTAGRGFIALAVVILSRRQPGVACLAALGFAFLESAGLQLQGQSSGAAVALTTGLPYVVTLFSLAILARPGVSRLRSLIGS
jgi:simple sugar transport system permease protein